MSAARKRKATTPGDGAASRSSSSGGAASAGKKARWAPDIELIDGNKEFSVEIERWCKLINAHLRDQQGGILILEYKCE